jgi:hypothetical protein
MIESKDISHLRGLLDYFLGIANQNYLKTCKAISMNTLNET